MNRKLQYDTGLVHGSNRRPGDGKDGTLNLGLKGGSELNPTSLLCTLTLVNLFIMFAISQNISSVKNALAARPKAQQRGKHYGSRTHQTELWLRTFNTS